MKACWPCLLQRLERRSLTDLLLRHRVLQTCNLLAQLFDFLLVLLLLALSDKTMSRISMVSTKPTFFCRSSSCSNPSKREASVDSFTFTAAAAEF